MEVGKLVLVTPWVDALREGYSSLERLVRWALELDGWTLGLATLYAPFFLIFAFYVVNDYFRSVQSSSSSSFNSLEVYFMYGNVVLFCRKAVKTKDVGTMTTNLPGEDVFLEEKSTSMEASVECKLEEEEVMMAVVDVDAARGVEVKLEDDDDNNDFPPAASDRKKTQQQQTISLRFTIQLTPTN
jgi:hypothetical protein